MLYEYSCKNGHHFERILPVADYRTKQTCDCGAEGRRVISLPKMITAKPDIRYDSPIDGRPITSWKQRANDLARNHCQEYDPEMRKDADRFRKQSDEKLDKAIDQTIEAQIDAMPVKKKESLERELKSGAEATIERRSV